MADVGRLICDGSALEEGGQGVRFEVEHLGARAPAFVVRFDGAVHGYINRCAHVPVQLDWQEGQFFDHSGLYLICATHGATYLPESGRCVAGPCKGRSLVKLEVCEREGRVYVCQEPVSDVR